jgi:tRNA(Ile)-lysidine synthase
VHKVAQSALAYIKKHDLVRAGDRVGVAVSGGADSVALLRLLLELRKDLGVVPLVVHLNHKLRGAESDCDEDFVRQLARAHALQLVCESRDVREYAAQNKLSLEAGAREARYEFFEGLLSGGDLNKIATAHTIDDQAETVLLKLARGAGTRGIAGIYPALQVENSAESTWHPALSTQPAKAIIRPLLGIRRADLQAYLTEIGQVWREDSSNRDLRHTRNRVRKEVLPRLEEHVNPRVRETLAEAAEIARDEEEFWMNQVSRLLPQVWAMSRNVGRLKRMGMDEIGVALQRRLVRAAAESFGLILEFQHVEDVLALSKNHVRAALPDGWRASWQKDEIIFQRHHDEPSDYDYDLPVPGKVEVAEAQLAIEALIVCHEGKHQAGLLDLRSARGRLVIRNWRAGDRFWPVGTKAPKKIKELLQDRRITGEEKKLWPVVAVSGEVVWVRGLGVRRDWIAKGAEGVLISESQLA